MEMIARCSTVRVSSGVLCRIREKSAEATSRAPAACRAASAPRRFLRRPRAMSAKRPPMSFRGQSVRGAARAAWRSMSIHSTRRCRSRNGSGGAKKSGATHHRTACMIRSGASNEGETRDRFGKIAGKMRLRTRVFDPVERVAVRLQNRCSAN